MFAISKAGKTKDFYKSPPYYIHLNYQNRARDLKEFSNHKTKKENSKNRMRDKSMSSKKRSYETACNLPSPDSIPQSTCRLVNVWSQSSNHIGRESNNCCCQAHLLQWLGGNCISQSSKRSQIMRPSGHIKTSLTHYQRRKLYLLS